MKMLRLLNGNVQKEYIFFDGSKHSRKQLCCCDYLLHIYFVINIDLGLFIVDKITNSYSNIYVNGEAHSVFTFFWSIPLCFLEKLHSTVSILYFIVAIDKKACNIHMHTFICRGVFPSREHSFWLHGFYCTQMTRNSIL